MELGDKEILEALKDIARDEEAPRDFVENLMAKIDLSPVPRKTLIVRIGDWLGQPWPAATRMAFAAVLVLLVVGAVPQYMRWLGGMLGSGPRDASAIMQAQLWKKNYACHNSLNARDMSETYAIVKGNRMYATVLACPSGDVLVQISSKEDGATRKLVWVPFDADRASMSQIFPSLVGTAFAEEGLLTQRGFQIAQALQVLCSKRLPNGFIKRRVSLRGGQCADEIIDPYTGRVVQSSPAPCTCAQF